MMENDSFYSTLRNALSKGDIDNVISLLEDNDACMDHRYVTHDLQTILMILCYVKLDASALRLVLEAIFKKKPDVNIQDSWGRTVLMHACIANNTIIIERLLANENTNISVIDFEGNSALSYAMQSCDLCTIETILQLPDGQLLLQICNTKGQSPYSCAEQRGDKNTIRLFESYLNQSKCMKEKSDGVHKQKIHGNRRLPPTYCPSPERILKSRSYQHSDLAKTNSFESQQLTRKLDFSETEKKHFIGESETTPITSSRDVVASLSLSSPKLSRHHHKRDCLLQETLLLNHCRTLPEIKKITTTSLDLSVRDDKYLLDLPEYSVRKQRRPSLSLPDLRNMTGCLVNSGNNTTTALKLETTLTKHSGKDDIEDVFAKGNYNASTCNKKSPSFNRQFSDKKFTLPTV